MMPPSKCSCPESKIEGLEPHNQFFPDPDFPDQKSLREIVERHGQFFFNHSIRKVSGLTVYICINRSECNLQDAALPVHQERYFGAS